MSVARFRGRPGVTMQARPGSMDDVRRLAWEDSRWTMESKLDGFRLLVVVSEDGSIEGFSRAGNAQDLEERLPHLHDALHDRVPPGTVLDGELVSGLGFDHVAGVMKSSPTRATTLQDTSGRLHLVLFDALMHSGDVLVDRTWSSRRSLLERVVDRVDSGRVIDSDAGPVDPDLAQTIMDDGGEGVMLKHVDSPYVVGGRPRHGWLKVKATSDADVVVTGFTDARHGRTGKFDGLIGAVEFGQYRDGVLVGRGRCSGMDDSVRREISADPQSFVGRVMVVRHMGIQRRGFRHPQFKGFRDDKLPKECVWDA